MRRFIDMVLHGLSGLLIVAMAGCGDGGGGEAVYEEASRFEQRGIHVLRLVGSHYEMGLQHGELMAPELAEGVEFVETDSLFSLLMPMAESQGLVATAREQSYADVVDECRGMAEAAKRAGTEGWSEDMCLTLAYGDVVIAFASELLDGGCTQFAAAGPATADGSLIHGRSMDWDELSYLIEHPTVIVRRPDGQIPFVTIGFPGNVAPYNGINAAGLAVASNNNVSDPEAAPNQRRRGHTQMLHQILATCSSLDEAEDYLREQQHARATTFLISDGAAATAAVFEMTADRMAVRRMDADGLVYATNHFIEPDMEDLHAPTSPQGSSQVRLERLRKLLEPDGADSLHGALDTEAGVAVLRDRYNPLTGQQQPADVFDNDGSIATNGVIWSMVFAPGAHRFYLAAGEPPVPGHAYVGFDVDALLEPGTPAAPPEPAVYE